MDPLKIFRLRVLFEFYGEYYFPEIYFSEHSCKASNSRVALRLQLEQGPLLSARIYLS